LIRTPLFVSPQTSHKDWWLIPEMGGAGESLLPPFLFDILMN